MSTSSPVIVAFDFASLNQVKRLAEQLDPAMCRAKVGKELFTAVGMPAVELLQSHGFEVFLDLKFHDIPNTVAAAVKNVAAAGIWMVNLHASGGERMMAAAKEVILQSNSATLLTAVTVLTSMTEVELRATGVGRSLQEQVVALAQSAQQQGLDGVVCSAQEAALLKAQCGESFVLVTPGIRPAHAAADDQRRTCTPQQALTNGSHYLVVGRPITQAADPQSALQQLFDE
jgi:orotidine-5'-phosphate decarboxylase